MARGRRSARAARRRRRRLRARPGCGPRRAVPRRTAVAPRRGWVRAPWSELPHLHLYRPLGAAMDELVDMGLAGMVDLADRTLPDQAAVIEHGDAMADLAGRRHVVGDRHRGGAEIADAFHDQ